MEEKQLKLRHCIDCRIDMNINLPTWKTRCPDCYSKHRVNLKEKLCLGCNQPFKGEYWKTKCLQCFRKSKEPNVTKIYRKNV